MVLMFMSLQKNVVKICIIVCMLLVKLLVAIVVRLNRKLKKRIIVFAYPTHNIDAEWIDRDTLRIKWKNSYTGKVIIKNFDVNKEHYDWREEN